MDAFMNFINGFVDAIKNIVAQMQEMIRNIRKSNDKKD